MQYKSLFLLGRQPVIGRAELESLFGAANVHNVGERAMSCVLPADQIDFARLGGSVRLAKILKTIHTTSWSTISAEVAAALGEIINTLPSEGKIKLGLSTIGMPVKTKQLFASGLELKKVCKQRGRNARLVPNAETELNTAQVLHNQLTGPLGIELLLVKDGARTIIAQTTAVQDIEAYARRDQGRPRRDARVGMLPPKLAQIIINLSGAQPNGTLLDPFCGTGVVLQEALLMGIDVYGSDLNPRMVEYTQQNLEWLAQSHDASQGGDLSMWYSLEVADATTTTFTSKHTAPIQHIACEAYLGRPFSATPRPEVLQEVAGDVNTIIAKFLQNVARQTEPGFRMCIAVPAWQTNSGLKHLPLLDHLEQIGYNRVRFEHVEADQLVYHRPDQIVARELLVITRK